MENICRFVPPYRSDAEGIRVTNFVLETHAEYTGRLRPESLYKVGLIAHGSGILHRADGDLALKAGDLFFFVPGMAVAVEPVGDLRFLYVSLLGERVQQLFDRAGVSAHDCLRRGHDALIPGWMQLINQPTAVADLAGEAAVLAAMAAVFARAEKPLPRTGGAAAAIRRFADEHFGDAGLSLDTIGAALGYHPKYVSSSFRAAFGVTLTAYLCEARLSHACALMDGGFTSVRDVAALCGFDDASYFSRLFRRRVGQSPEEYIRRAGQEKTRV